MQNAPICKLCGNLEGGEINFWHFQYQKPKTWKTPLKIIFIEGGQSLRHFWIYIPHLIQSGQMEKWVKLGITKHLNVSIILNFSTSIYFSEFYLVLARVVHIVLNTFTYLANFA